MSFFSQHCTHINSPTPHVHQLRLFLAPLADQLCTCILICVIQAARLLPSPPLRPTSLPGPGSPSNGAAAYSPPELGSPSSATARRQYKDHFTHQYAHVSDQTDQGLRAIKRTAAFFEHTVDIQIAACEGAIKQMKSVKDKYADVKDECTHYVNASLMVEEVMEHTEKTQLVFSQSIANELVKPMRAWYKVNSEKKMKLDKEMGRVNDKLKAAVEDINKERKQCQLAFTEVKTALQQVKAMESGGQTGSKEYNNAKTKHTKAKEATIKKFQTFEQHLDNIRTIQASYYSKDVPAKLTELEQIERDRLSYQQECYMKFQGIFMTYVNGLKSSSELMSKVLPTLNINKAMNLLFDKWTAAFGAPPALLSVPYDLPCHWTEIQNDVLDSQGGAAAAALNNSPTAVMSPSSGQSGGGGFAHSPVAVPAAGGYANSYSQPPPPPPEYDDGAANPFADAAAHASRGGPPSGAGGGSGEPPLFWAEALFDFELVSDGGDITYVNFKAGDRIAVTQEGRRVVVRRGARASGLLPVQLH